MAILGLLVSSARGAPATTAVEPHFVYNGSFEMELPGMRPMVPHGWVVARSTARDDHMTLVDDPAVAHWGNRCVRLASPGPEGIALHSFANAIAFPVTLAPGHAYTVRVWARRATEAAANLTVEPGGGQWPLTRDWRQYTCRHDHPADAPEAMGATIRIHGGPALVDDMSITPALAEATEAAELKADRSTLASLPVERAWSVAADGPAWRHRTAVRISAVMNVPARHSPIRLELRRIRPGLRFDHIGPDRVKVIDTSDPAALVPFAFIETTVRQFRCEQRTGWDQIVFLADCPARSTKVYHIYFEDGPPVASGKQWPDDVPAGWP